MGVTYKPAPSLDSLERKVELLETCVLALTDEIAALRRQLEGRDPTDEDADF